MSDDIYGLNRQPAYEVVLLCKKCRNDYLVHMADCKDCPKCGYNYWWVGEEFQKFTGPEYRPVTARVTSRDIRKEEQEWAKESE